jgi:CelD/BcsL family acetyltransferase involved in cellulose biosynthesis
LRVDSLSDAAALDALAPEWDALATSLSPRTPFATPLWNQLWWRHFREDRGAVRDELRLRTVRDARGTLLAVAPMMLTRRPSFGPLQLRVLQFFGSDPNITELRGPACRSEHQATALKALHVHLMEHESGWDWLHWCGIRAEPTEPPGMVPGALHESVSDYYLPLPNSWDEFRGGLSRNIKESLRKCYNSLKREAHRFEFRVVRRPEEVPAAISRFLLLHASRAHARDTVRHADVFRSQRARAFLGEYAQRLAERDQLRVFQLCIGGEVVATRIGFLFGDELYLYYSGFDPDWGRYSVMTTVLAETIKWAIEQRLRLLNLSTGRDTSKTRWNPVEVQFRGGVQTAPHPRGRFAFRAYHRLLEFKNADSALGRLVAQAARGG